jgi:DNA-binding CsgD family transcriptional regulator
MTSATVAVLPVPTSGTFTSEPADRVSVDLRETLAAFLAGRDVGHGPRDEIGASWRRSAASGLRPDHVEVPFDPDVDSEGMLVRAARPVIDQLAVDLTGAPVGVVLTNERGHVLDRRVSEASLHARLDRILLAPGFVYAEELIGTNAIGTALAQRAAAAVDGEEHFVDALTRFACAAAPITDPRSGRVLGVIDLTSLARDASVLMLPLATRAAREIELRLLDDVGVSERLILQRFLQERRWAKGPLVFITQRSMITNAAADRLIEADDEPVLREWASRPPSGEPVMLSGGTVVTVRWDPLLDGGSHVGAMLRRKPVLGSGSRRPQGRDSRPTFGWESLTDTEGSVIDLVAEGLTNREAAERLFLSHHTVGFHLRSIFGKLGVRSRVELTRLAIEHDPARQSHSTGLFALPASR